MAATPEGGGERLGRALDDGSALSTFEAMLEAQGVPPTTARALCAGTPQQRRRVLGGATTVEELRAPHDGEGLGGGRGAPTSSHSPIPTHIVLPPHSPTPNNLQPHSNPRPRPTHSPTPPTHSPIPTRSPTHSPILTPLP